MINQQFNTVPERLFANFSEMLKKDPENERPRYKGPVKRARDYSRMFENIEEASGFWRKLWEDGESCGRREGLGIRTRPGCRK